MRELLLFSGGMESIALAYLRQPELLLFVDYGQLPAKGELQAATAAARILGLNLRAVTVDCRAVGSGELAGAEPSDKGATSDWWPFRNQLLVTLAAAVAIAEGANIILLGTVADDKIFADGTIEFIERMGAVMALQEGAINLDAPAISWTSKELVQESGVPLSLLARAHSCLVSNWACGFCRGCQKWRQVIDDLR